MFIYILILIALIGSSVAGWFDLKTTEIPDEIPLLMVLIGAVVKGIQFLLTWNFNILLDSLLIGGFFLLFGFALYYTGQWGGGDAKILSSIGFLLPVLPSSLNLGLLFPFYISFLINFFVIGALYIIVYAFIFTLINPQISKQFLSNLKGENKEILTFISIMIALILFSILYFYSYLGLTPNVILYSLPGVIGLYLLWRFLKTVEESGFKKKINTNNLREGDMLGKDLKEIDLDSKLIRGLTKEEVEKIREIKDKVWIKEGVRFAPVFPLALGYTILVGDIIALLI